MEEIYRVLPNVSLWVIDERSRVQTKIPINCSYTKYGLHNTVFTIARYENGKALCCSNYGPKQRETQVVTGLNCNGTEGSLAECDTTGGYCRNQHNNYGSAYCYNGQISDGMVTSFTSWRKKKRLNAGYKFTL